MSDHLICTPHVPVTIRLGEDQEAVLIITTFGEKIQHDRSLFSFCTYLVFAEVTGSIDECFISDLSYLFWKTTLLQLQDEQQKG